MGAPCYPPAVGITPACSGAAATCTLVNYLNRTRMDSLSLYLGKYKQLVRPGCLCMEFTRRRLLACTLGCCRVELGIMRANAFLLRPWCCHARRFSSMGIYRRLGSFWRRPRLRRWGAVWGSGATQNELPPLLISRAQIQPALTALLRSVPSCSDRFVAGFYWLHAMGMVAEAGFQQVNRQDFAGWSFTGRPSQYALVGQPGWVSGAGLLQPHPDYFTVSRRKSAPLVPPPTSPLRRAESVTDLTDRRHRVGSVLRRF